ncbi:fasciclin, partial [Pseudomonas sp. HMWF031]
MKKLISAFFLVVLSASAVAGHHAKDGHKDIVDTAASNDMFST